MDTLPIAPASRRILGFIVDLSLLVGLQFFGAYFGGVVAATILSYRRAPASVVDQSVISGMILGWGFWGLAIFILNYGLLQGVTGSTMGKLAMGTQVICQSGKKFGIVRSLLRTFLYGVSAFPAGVGLMWAFRTPGARTWHDSLTGTVVVLRTFPGRVIALPAAADLDERKAA